MDATEYTYDSLPNAETTYGVGRNRGITYRTARIVCTIDGSEHDCRIRISSQGKRTIEDFGRTAAQRAKDELAAYMDVPEFARRETERLFQGCNVFQKTVLARMFAGLQYGKLTACAILGGRAREAFLCEFPGCQTLNDAERAMRERGQSLLARANGAAGSIPASPVL